MCVCVRVCTNRNGKRVQPVEQARPGNESEEEMQLKLALQLSKQQADEEANIRYISYICLYHG